PYLEQELDLNDYEAARVFFTRAAVPAVHHVTGHQECREVERHALYYPARKGCGTRLARLLAQQDEMAADDPRSPVCGSTIFQCDEIVLRLIDVRGGLDADPVLTLGLPDPRQAAELTTILDGAALKSGDLQHFLMLARMTLITDRRSSPAI
ncbi:TcmI family type II polyketide cyclase, partial [Streptomyces chiangmaiensis]|nr:TcmI family type II polyketide cyclase [Streptomyces chiangmaiensis]